MKKTLLSIFAFVTISGNIACSDDSSSSTGTNQSQVVDTVVSGSWKITMFSEDGADKTGHFTGYNFTFAANYALTAENGTNTYTGVWSVTSDDSSDDDNPGSDVDFNIMFASPADFAELNEDWHILQRTTTKLSLQHVSGGNGGTDNLVFEKN